MLKWAMIFAVAAIVAGILGFVVNVAGAIAKFLFFVFLIGAVATFVLGKMSGKKAGEG